MPLPGTSLPDGNANSRKRVPRWQSWEKAAQDKGFLAIVAVLVLSAAAVLSVIAFKLRDARNEHHRLTGQRPTVVNQHPPVLLQPFACDSGGGFRAGEMRVLVKNVGDAKATNVTPTLSLRVIAEQSVGVPDIDRIPRGNCRDTPIVVPAGTSLAAGEDASLRPRQSLLTLPPLPRGRPASLYSVSCIYYADETGANHASCDTYRFRPATGTPTFLCDGTANSGTFDAALVANCAY
jgi:hypothetical protein